SECDNKRENDCLEERPGANPVFPFTDVPYTHIFQPVAAGTEVLCAPALSCRSNAVGVRRAGLGNIKATSSQKDHSSGNAFRKFRERFVPKGHCDNSPAFQRWGPRPSGGKSRRDDRVTAINQRCRNEPSFVPPGLMSLARPNPAMNRWAIAVCPCGTGAGKVNFRKALGLAAATFQ